SAGSGASPSSSPHAGSGPCVGAGKGELILQRSIPRVRAIRVVVAGSKAAAELIAIRVARAVAAVVAVIAAAELSMPRVIKPPSMPRIVASDSEPFLVAAVVRAAIHSR